MPSSSAVLCATRDMSAGVLQGVVGAVWRAVDLQRPRSRGQPCSCGAAPLPEWCTDGSNQGLRGAAALSGMPGTMWSAPPLYRCVCMYVPECMRFVSAWMGQSHWAPPGTGGSYCRWQA